MFIQYTLGSLNYKKNNFHYKTRTLRYRVMPTAPKRISKGVCVFPCSDETRALTDGRHLIKPCERVDSFLTKAIRWPPWRVSPWLLCVPFTGRCRAGRGKEPIRGLTQWAPLLWSGGPPGQTRWAPVDCAKAPSGPASTAVVKVLSAGLCGRTAPGHPLPGRWSSLSQGGCFPRVSLTLADGLAMHRCCHLFPRGSLL